jgi:hypothetical protein
MLLSGQQKNRKNLNNFCTNFEVDIWIFFTIILRRKLPEASVEEHAVRARYCHKTACFARPGSVWTQWKKAA